MKKNEEANPSGVSSFIERYSWDEEKVRRFNQWAYIFNKSQQIAVGAALIFTAILSIIALTTIGRAICTMIPQTVQTAVIGSAAVALIAFAANIISMLQMQRNNLDKESVAYHDLAYAMSLLDAEDRNRENISYYLNHASKYLSGTSPYRISKELKYSIITHLDSIDHQRDDVDEKFKRVAPEIAENIISSHDAEMSREAAPRGSPPPDKANASESVKMLFGPVINQPGIWLLLVLAVVSGIGAARFTGSMELGVGIAGVVVAFYSVAVGNDQD